MSVMVAVTWLVVWFLASPRIESRDERWLFYVNGVPVDALGVLEEYWGRVTSDCSGVADLSNDTITVAALLDLLQRFSPPDSLSARIVSVRTTQDWWVVEATFDYLPPAWVVFSRSLSSAEGIQIREVWSGSTFPWRAMPFAGRYFRSRLPDVPAELLRCGRVQFG